MTDDDRIDAYITLAKLLAAEQERNRLYAWLKKIEGGDNPCRDEAQLRQWAYEAITLGKEAPDE